MSTDDRDNVVVADWDGNLYRIPRFLLAGFAAAEAPCAVAAPTLPARSGRGAGADRRRVCRRRR